MKNLEINKIKRLKMFLFSDKRRWYLHSITKTQLKYSINFLNDDIKIASENDFETGLYHYLCTVQDDLQRQLDELNKLSKIKLFTFYLKQYIITILQIIKE